MIIIRDNKEKVGYWEFDFIENCQQVSASLKTGDYTIKGLEDIVCLERKRTTGELSINLGSKWEVFSRELQRMEPFKYKYILLEFSLDDVLNFPKNSGIPQSKWQFIKIHPKFILGRIEYIKKTYNIKVIFCGSKQNAEIEAASILQMVYETEK